MGEVSEASRNIEFTNPMQHVGWKKGRAVFVVFNIDMAKAVFELQNPIAICVAPPFSAVAQELEQCVSFFSSGGPRSFVEASIFAIDA